MARAVTSKRVGVLTGLMCLATAALLAQSAYDLSVGVTAPGSATVNLPASFGVQVVNAGTGSVTVTAVFQPAVGFNAAGSTSTCSANSANGDPSTTVVCTGTSVTVSVTPQTVGTLNVVVGAISDQPDTNMLNNYDRRTVPITSVPGVKGDFNGDGQTDILWRHASGYVYVWLMNGTTVTSGASPPSADTSWKIVGTADFNGDGKTDILWEHTSGAVYVWLMNGTTVTSGVSLPSVDPSWSIVGTGDFNGDGQADILWRNTNGGVYVWMMNGTTVASGVSLPTTDTSWSIAGTGDFNGDGQTDIVWRHTSGAVYVWLMNGTTVTSGVSLPPADPSWSIVGTGDFNGDGKTDILWEHTSGGVLVWLMNGTTVASIVSLPSVDPIWSIVGPK